MRSFLGWFVLIATCLPAVAGERVFEFSKYPTNQPPAGFRSTLSGGGELGEWKIRIDDAPVSSDTTKASSATKTAVLAQLSRDGADEHFPMLIFDEEIYGDFTLSTRLKLVDGAVEQMAGIAFRVQDTNNFYYVRASSLGNSFRFIKLVNGQRLTTIGPTVEIAKGVWHDLTIDCQGNRMKFLFDGKELIPPLNDNTFTSGKVAFWTKSDSVAYFGDTKIVFTPHETLAQILVRETTTRYPRLAGLKIFAMPANASMPKVVASAYPDEVGQSGGRTEAEVITRDVIYQGKEGNFALVTLPLHDRNGEVAAAVRVILHSFPGQTEQNALARAQPVVKEMERRVRMAKDLLQ